MMKATIKKGRPRLILPNMNAKTDARIKTAMITNQIAYSLMNFMPIIFSLGTGTQLNKSC